MNVEQIDPVIDEVKLLFVLIVLVIVIVVTEEDWLIGLLPIFLLRQHFFDVLPVVAVGGRRILLHFPAS